MSHNITATDSVMSVRQMPWHGLGVVLDDYPTREEAQHLTMDWEPVETAAYRKVPFIAEDGTLTEVYEELPGTKVIERSDNGDVIGVPNSTLGLITNNELWDISEAIGKVGGQSEVMYETAGSLEGGAKVWILMRLTEPLHVKGDPNGATIAGLALQNSHNGSGALRAQAINTRIVCANTSSAADMEAKANGYEFTFRHTSGIKDRIEEAKAAVQMWHDGVTMWMNGMEHLINVKVGEAVVRQFVDEFHPMPNERMISDRVRTNVETARGELLSILNSETSEGVRNTAYGLYQSGIEWQQHFRATRGSDNRSRMENHFKRSLLSTDSFRRDTLALVKELTNA